MSKLQVQFRKMTALNLYLDRVQDTYDRIRASNSQLSFLPAQLGGINGQRAILRDKMVVQDISFENRE